MSDKIVSFEDFDAMSNDMADSYYLETADDTEQTPAAAAGVDNADTSAELEQLRRENAELREVIKLFTPVTDDTEIQSFAADMAANKDKAVGAGITPILWTMANRQQSGSEKQLFAAKKWANSNLVRWRSLQAVLAGDEETLQLLEQYCN